MTSSLSSSSSASALPISFNSNFLYVHSSQKGNPVLNHLKNVQWQYTNEIKVDYLMNTTGALFLSVRYHHRHPKYIIRRVEEVGNMYRTRVLLVLVDDDQQLPLLQELNRLAFVSNFTLIFAWSNLECARYLETFKNYENKSSQSIQSKEESEFLPKLHKILSSHIKSVNKTDVITLLDVFQNVHNIFQAKEEQLILCPGIGEKKAKRLYSVFHEPFKKQSSEKTSKSVYQQSLEIIGQIEIIAPTPSGIEEISKNIEHSEIERNLITSKPKPLPVFQKLEKESNKVPPSEEVMLDPSKRRRLEIVEIDVHDDDHNLL